MYYTFKLLATTLLVFTVSLLVLSFIPEGSKDDKAKSLTTNITRSSDLDFSKIKDPNVRFLMQADTMLNEDFNYQDLAYIFKEIYSNNMKVKFDTDITTRTRVNDFFVKYIPIALEVGIQENYAPSVILAQLAIESGWGTKHSGINNILGLKGDGKMCTTQEEFTEEELKAFKGKVITKKLLSNGKYNCVVEDSFRTFESEKECVLFYVRKLKGSKYYKGLHEQPLFYKTVAKSLKKYATRTGYTKQIVKIVEDYNLYVLDRLVGIQMKKNKWEDFGINHIELCYQIMNLKS